MSLNTKPRVRRINLLIAIVLVLIAVGAAAVYALLQLNVPSTPGISAPNGVAKIMSVCNGAIVNTETAPFASTGTMRYTCDSTHGAFTIDIVGTDTPTFNLPGNYTALGMVPKSAASCSTMTVLTSGTQVTFSTSTDYDLCASYVSTTGGTLPGFSVQWSS